jgi:hypothetical protein
MPLNKIIFGLAAASVAITEARNTISPHTTNTRGARKSILSELTDNFRRGHEEDHLRELEAELRPIYVTMKKNEHGSVGFAQARYAMHRLFVEQHGWTIAGLEPWGDSAEDSSMPSDALMKWMPRYLVNSIEQLMGTHGVSLRELAVLAATFEDLIHKEAAGRLEELYDMLNLPTSGRIGATESEKVITYYTAMYTSGGNTTVRTVQDIAERKAGLDLRTVKWLRDVRHQIMEKESQCDAASGECDKLDFPAATRVVEEIGEKYGPFNDGLCQDLKSTLMKSELEQTGLVPLADFYAEGVKGSWNFSETTDYLRELGAFDEERNSVIIPNYVSSRPNCLTASTIYMVCCRNECEGKLAHLEKKLATSSAVPGRIIELVESLLAPQKLSQTLIESLQALALEDDGWVSLHSKGFANWMHQVYPRECPRPHAPGSTMGPQTADEWLKEDVAKPEASAVSQEELEAAHHESKAVEVDQEAAHQESKAVEVDHDSLMV